MREIKIGRLRRFLITANSSEMGAIWACMMIIVFTGLAFLGRGFDISVLAILGINIVVFTLGGMWFAWIMERQLRATEDRIGLRLTDADKLALFCWVRHGVRPTSQRLQPILPAYLDHLHDNFSGKNLHFSNTHAVISIGLFGILFAVSVTTLIAEQTWGNVLQTVFFAVMLALSAWSVGNRTNPLIRLLNRRNFQRLDEMRKQL